MKFSSIILSACTLGSVVATQFNIDVNDLFQRDDDFNLEARSVQSIEEIIYGINSSNIIWDTLDAIAASNATMDKIAATASSLLSGNSLTSSLTSSLSGLGINLTLNKSEILGEVEKSGLITTTLKTLFADPTNNQKLANFTISLLTSHYYIGLILIDLSHSIPLTVDHIANVIKAHPAVPLPDSSSTGLKDVYFGFDKRANNNTAGSASTFFNNLIGGIASLSLVSGSVSDVLTALNDTNFVSDLVLQSLDQPLLGTIILYVVPKIYASGGFDKIDIQSALDKTKETGSLAHLIQTYFTKPSTNEIIGGFFTNMKATGLYPTFVRNMFPK